MYKIVLNKEVTKNDFKSIQKSDLEKILQSIYKKLSIDPVAFGKPLTNKLKGYFRLRVMDYRVIYEINKNEVTVFIVKIGARKDLIAYLEAVKRLGL